MTEELVLERVGEIEGSRHREIQQEISSHIGLKTARDWCLASEPPILDTEVVTQDEFTHDLIVPLRDGLFLVYDST